MGSYLGTSEVQGLRAYRYKGSASSFLDVKVLGPFWTWLVEWVPLWVAPNLITLLGLVILLSSTIIIQLQTQTLQEEVPAWSWYLLAICLFIYQSLDAIDGKQARRTGSSSPLGQLFDHGCDAVTCVCLGINVSTAVKATPLSAFALFWLHCLPFFISNWEE
jgi:phosphatidylglycerophosphate synthase